MGESIINIFNDNFFLDLLVQGILLTLFVLIGLVIFFKEYQGFLKAIDLTLEAEEINQVKKDLMISVFQIINLFSKRKPVSEIFFYLYNIALLGCLSFTILIISGIIGNRFSDTWIDSKPLYHLGLKHTWIEPDENFNWSSNKTGAIVNVDSAIKIRTFDKVFSDKVHLNNSKKLQVYYEAKTKFINSKEWRDYLTVTQRLINYSQVLAFSILSLLVILYADLFLASIISVIEFYKKFDPKKWKKNWTPGLRAAIVIISLNAALLIVFLIFSINEYLYIHIIFLSISAITFYVIFLISKRSHKENRHKTTLITYRLLLITFCIFSYFAVCTTWQENEKEFDFKLYNIVKVECYEF